MTMIVRTDEQIQKDVLAQLRWEPRLRPNEIGVIVKDGIVTLTGRVESYAKRWAAEDVAHRVASVKAVANDIEVRLPGTEGRADADIAAAARRALEWDVLVPADKIDVTVSNGWVTLEGEVEWRYEKQDAERVIQRLVGVTGVSNNLAVTPRPASFEVEQQIKDALVRNALIDADRIDVDIEGTKAILKGKVRSWIEAESSR